MFDNYLADLCQCQIHNISGCVSGPVNVCPFGRHIILGIIYWPFNISQRHSVYYPFFA